MVRPTSSREFDERIQEQKQRYQSKIDEYKRTKQQYSEKIYRWKERYKPYLKRERGRGKGLVFKTKRKISPRVLKEKYKEYKKEATKLKEEQPELEQKRKEIREIKEEIEKTAREKAEFESRTIKGYRPQTIGNGGYYKIKTVAGEKKYFVSKKGELVGVEDPIMKKSIAKISPQQKLEFASYKKEAEMAALEMEKSRTVREWEPPKFKEEPFKFVEHKIAGGLDKLGIERERAYFREALTMGPQRVMGQIEASEKKAVVAELGFRQKFAEKYGDFPVRPSTKEARERMGLKPIVFSEFPFETAKAAGRIFGFGASLATRPVETIKGIPSGFRELPSEVVRGIKKPAYGVGLATEFYLFGKIAEPIIKPFRPIIKEGSVEIISPMKRTYAKFVGMKKTAIEGVGKVPRKEFSVVTPEGGLMALQSRVLEVPALKFVHKYVARRVPYRFEKTVNIGSAGDIWMRGLGPKPRVAKIKAGTKVTAKLDVKTGKTILSGKGAAEFAKEQLKAFVPRKGIRFGIRKGETISPEAFALREFEMDKLEGAYIGETISPEFAGIYLPKMKEIIISKEFLKPAERIKMREKYDITPRATFVHELFHHISPLGNLIKSRIGSKSPVKKVIKTLEERKAFLKERLWVKGKGMIPGARFRIPTRVEVGKIGPKKVGLPSLEKLPRKAELKFYGIAEKELTSYTLGVSKADLYKLDITMRRVWGKSKGAMGKRLTKRQYKLKSYLKELKQIGLTRRQRLELIKKGIARERKLFLVSSKVMEGKVSDVSFRIPEYPMPKKFLWSIKRIGKKPNVKKVEYDISMLEVERPILLDMKKAPRIKEVKVREKPIESVGVDVMERKIGKIDRLQQQVQIPKIDVGVSLQPLLKTQAQAMVRGIKLEIEKFGPETIRVPVSSLRVPQIQMSETRQELRIEPRVETRMETRLTPRLKMRPETRLEPKIETRLEPRLTTRLQTRLSFRLKPPVKLPVPVKPPRIVPPRYPPGIIRTKKAKKIKPLIKMGKIKTKRIPKYEPSLYALEFGIKTKKKQRPFTPGIEIRPMEV